MHWAPRRTLRLPPQPKAPRKENDDKFLPANVAAVDFVPLVHGNRGLFPCGNLSRKPCTVDLVSRRVLRVCAHPNSDKRNQDFENRFADYWPISSENGFCTAGIPDKGFCAYQRALHKRGYCGGSNKRRERDAGGVKSCAAEVQQRAPGTIFASTGAGVAARSHRQMLPKRTISALRRRPGML